MLRQKKQKSYLSIKVFIGIAIALGTFSFAQAQNSAARVYQTANPFVFSQEDAPLKEPLSEKITREAKESNKTTGNFLHELNKSLYVQSEADVLFGSGDITLSAKTLEHLDLIVKMFRRDINRHRINFPDEQVVLLIDIKGYTDTKGFYYGQSTAERQAQNKLLSQKRAAQVEAYLRKNLQNTADVIEFQSIGLGEELPQSTKDLEKNPSLRRSCKIYSLLYAERYTHTLVHK